MQRAGATASRQLAKQACTCGIRQRQSSRRNLSTINQDEISHFASLAATWWDEAGDFNVLQRMNKVRLQFLRDRLSEEGMIDFQDPVHFLKGKKVLDVGCGGGLFTERLARLGADTLAIDASEENVQTATLHASQDPRLLAMLEAGQLEYRASAVEHLPGARADAQSQDQFDVVCAMEVLEHVEDPPGFLRSLANLSKPGGHLILSTIARTPLARLLAIDLAESPLIRLAPAGSHTYSKFVLPSEIEAFFKNELQWTASPSSSADASIPQGHLTPDQISPRHALEARGTTYLPWKGEWTLLQKDHGGIGAKLSKSVNFFFGARKPLSASDV